MIKNWKEFIKESIDTDTSNYIDRKMQEISKLIEDISEGRNIIYEWQTKNDHDVVVTFSTDNISVNYDFDIDDLYVVKTYNNKIDFQVDVSSIDNGISLIEKDIKTILDIN